MVSSAYAWVRPELEGLFEDLAQVLEQLASSTANGARADGRTIDRLVHLLEQLRGTLVMLELVSVLRVIDEMSTTLREIAREQAPPDAVEGLVEVGLQLPDVVDALAASDRDGTGALLGWPLVNRLREARGLAAIEQAPIGTERWALLAPEADQDARAGGESSPSNLRSGMRSATNDDEQGGAAALLRRCRRERQRFQRALLGLMRQGGDVDAINDLISVCDDLVRLMPHVDLRRLAWVTRALLESLRARPERWTADIKRLLGRVDRQLGWFLRRFEDRLREAAVDLADFPQEIYAVPAELVDQLLQLISQPEYDADSTRAVRAGLSPDDEPPRLVTDLAAGSPSSRAGRSVIEHFRQVIDEAWLEQRTRLETLLSLPTRSAHEFSVVAEGLDRLADTLVIAGDEPSAERARTLAQAVAALDTGGADLESAGHRPSGALSTGDEQSLDIAQASIELEQAIQRFFAQSSSPSPGALAGAGGASGSSLNGAVFAEVLREIGEVKVAALALFSAAAVETPAASIRQPVVDGLERVQGVLAMAAADTLAGYVGRVREAVAVFPVRDASAPASTAAALTDHAIEALAEAVAVAEVAAESLLRPLFDLDKLISGGDALLRRFHRLLADAASSGEPDPATDRLDVPSGTVTEDAESPAMGPASDNRFDIDRVESASVDQPLGDFGLEAEADERSAPQADLASVADEGPNREGVRHEPGGLTQTSPPRPSEPETASAASASEGSASSVAHTERIAAFEFDRDVLEGVALVEDSDPDLQAEIVEVFIEEAEDACARIGELWPLWSVNRSHVGHLSEIRRAFHTLKGSGRMAGALRLGEFAWSVEAFLNWLLRQSVEADDAMVAALDDARQAMPRLIDEVRGQASGAVPVLDIAMRLRWLTIPRDDAEPDDAEWDPPVSGDTAPGDTAPGDIASGVPESSVLDANVEAADLRIDSHVAGSDAGIGVLSTAAVPDATMPLARVAPDAGPTGAAAADAGVITPESGTTSGEALWSPELDETLWSIFVEEARQHLATVEDLLQRVAQSVASETGEAVPTSIDQAFVAELDDTSLRAIHTLHGASRALALPVLSCVMAPLERLMAVVLEAGRSTPDNPISDPPPGVYAAVADAVEAARWVAALSFDDAREIHGREDLGAEGVWPGGIDGRLMLDLAATLETLRQAFAPLSFDSGDHASQATDPPARPAEVESAVDGGAQLDEVAGRDASNCPNASDGPEAPGVDAAPEVDAAPVEADASIDAEFADVFLEEAVDLLEASDRALRDWRETGALIAADAQSAFLREVHTLKGSARMAGFARIGALAHGIETAVAEEQRHFGAVRPELFDVLDQALAAIENWVRRGAVVDQTRIDADSGVLAVLRTWPSGPAALDWQSASARRVGTQAEVEPAGSSDARLDPARSAEDGHFTDGAIEPGSEPSSLDGSREIAGASADEMADAQPGPVHDAPRGGATPDVRVSADGPQDKTRSEAASDGVRGRVDEPQEQVRVPALLLDTMVNEAGEILTFQRRVDQGVARLGTQLDELDRTVSRLRQQLRSLEIETEAQILFRVDQAAQAGGEFDPLEMDRYSGLQQLARALAESVNDLDSLRGEIGDAVQGSAALLEQQARVVEDLQSHLASQRLVSFSRSVPRLRRVAQQAAVETRRLVDVRFEGAQVQLDRAVLDRLIGPLEHLLRNALVHGIERPEEREQLAKPRTGSLRISLRQVAGELHLDVFDDGRGIDPARVRARAIEAGLLAADAELRDEDVIPLILQPGFSTASEVTELAGRGVGLDVVNSEIKQLGGRLQIASKVGRGTQFQLRVPLSLTVTKALVVSRGEHTIAVPVSGIEGVVRIQASELDSDGQTRWFDALDRTWQLFDLAGLLDPEHSAGAMFPVPDHPFPVLLVRDDGPIAAAVFVDSIRQSQEIVVKSVGAVLSRLPAIAGATLSADGEVHVIMDLPSLLRFQTQMRAVPVLPEEHRPHTPRVLVVDDSVTIRKVTTRVLERAGYEAYTARDGLEAVGLLDELAPDLILLDVEMPRMDGFEFATHVRDHETLSDLPIIMITSRTGAKHRERARTIGVNGYLGKPFLEHELLAEIRQWLARATAPSEETMA